MNRRKIFPFVIAYCLVIANASTANGQGPGFPNVPQAKGALLSGPIAPQGGRTAVVAFHQGYLITQYEGPGSKPGSDGVSRYFDISNPRLPKEFTFGAGLINAASSHGYWQERIALRGLGDWTFSGSQIRRTANEAEAGGTYYHTWTAGAHDSFPWPGRGVIYQPWHVTQYWTYAETSHAAGLFKGNQLLASFNPVAETGVIGHPILIGNWLIYASEQSHTGIAIYDITPSLDSPGTKPELIGLYREPLDPGNPTVSVGGYWPEIWGGGGRLKLFFPDQGRGIHIVDITDPRNIRLEKTWRWSPKTHWWKEPEPNYVQFQDIFAFSDRFKVNMLTYEVEELFDPTEFGLSVTQFSLPIGNLLATGGYHNDFIGANSQGLAIWAHQSEPDSRGPFVGFHIPRRDKTNYHPAAPITLMIHETLRTETIVNGETFSIRPVSVLNELGPPVPGRISFTFNDALTFTPFHPFEENTTYEVALAPGGIHDAAGNATAAYSFRFSTGDVLVPISSGTEPSSPADPELPPDIPAPPQTEIPLDETNRPESPGTENPQTTHPLDFTLKLSKRSGVPRTLVVALSAQVAELLPIRTQGSSKRRRRIRRSRGFLQVMLNSSVIKRQTFSARRVVRVSLPPKRVKQSYRRDMQNVITVEVSAGKGDLLARGSRAF